MPGWRQRWQRTRICPHLLFAVRNVLLVMVYFKQGNFLYAVEIGVGSYLHHVLFGRTNGVLGW